jgi:outer membrane protein
MLNRTMMKKTVLSLSVAAMMAGGQSALAYEAGDIILRGGAATVDPDESSSPIVIDTLGLGAAANAQVGVGSDTQLGVTLSYMYTPSFGIELLVSTPFTHDINGAGDIAGIGKLAEATHLPPTLTANYYFNDPSSDFQPYIGGGINYTIFFDEEVTPTLDNGATFGALAGLAGAPGAVTDASGTNIDLNDSWGLALHLGFDYKLTEDLGVNVSYWSINLDTEAEISTNTNIGQVKAHVDVDIDPSVYMAGIYYKF